ncbi:MAG: winged helix-turn-helix domain-containing protein [Pirellulaceae bacterium]|jgi:transposase
MRTKGSAEELEARRLRAFALFKKGLTPTQVAEQIGVTRQTAQRWKGLIRDGGKKALNSIPQHVPTCRLTEEQQADLSKIIQSGATAAGFSTDLWTTKRLAEVVRKRFKIKYHPDHLGRLLHQLGFSCQKPAKKAREQRPEEANQWRRQSWPRVKKGAKNEC